MLGVKCGFVENATTQTIVEHDDIAMFRNQFKDECHLFKIFVELPEFIMTHDD